MRQDRLTPAAGDRIEKVDKVAWLPHPYASAHCLARPRRLCSTHSVTHRDTRTPSG